MKIKNILLSIAATATVVTPLTALTGCNHTVSVSEVKITTTQKAVIKNNTVQMTAQVLPENASNKELKWSVDNTDLATIDEKTGLLTAKAAGPIVVTATATDGSEKKVDYAMSINEVKTQWVYAYAESEVVGEGKSVQLTSYVYPKEAYQGVTWEVLDPTCGSVTADGVFTATKEGTCQIKCTAGDGTGMSYTISVACATKLASSVEIKLPAGTSSIKRGQNVSLEFSMLPADASVKDVKWHVADAYKNDAIIDVNGNVIVTSSTQPTGNKIDVYAVSADGNATSNTLSIPVTDADYVPDAKEYLTDRTLSIQCGQMNESGSQSSFRMGTAWILADAAPDYPDAYWYYIALPKSLQNDFDRIEKDALIGGGKYAYRFCTREGKYQDDGCNPLYDNGNYQTFNTYYKLDVKGDEGTSVTGKTFEKGELKGLAGIDLQICLVDFSSALKHKNDWEVSKSLFRKLNKMKALSMTSTTKGVVSKFANMTEDGKIDGKDLTAVKLYTAGYPMAYTGSNAKWQYHEIGADGELATKLDFEFNKDGDKKYRKVTTDANPVVDIAPYFYFADEKGLKQWMRQDGGAGSILVVDEDPTVSHDYRILGMYWGTTNDKSGVQTTYPVYSVLKSDYFNFMSDWEAK